MGTIGGNGEEVRGHKHRVSYTDHEEARATGSRRDMGDALGGISARSGGNTAGDDIHRETTGNRVTVGGVITNI